jgi:GT2 family glycosyltransferase
MAEFAGPLLSVVVPVHNSARTLERCLSAIAAQLVPGDELIVVDDGSTDDVRSVAIRFNAALIRLEPSSGPAAARNRGADRATRPALLFVDADVVLHADAIQRGRAQLGDPSIDGVIGSYDDSPECRTRVSQFKNLAHHYFHQSAGGRVGSFWSGCGFIKREVFQAAGGFDEGRFSRPSIEDVELGWRITDLGGQVVLNPQIQGTHLKCWTLWSLIKTDVFCRAVPWVRWSLERRRLGGVELNASRLQQLALATAVLLLTTGALTLSSSTARGAFALLVVLAFAINRPLFQLFWRKGGMRLLVAGFLLQQLYYLCALTGLVLGVVRFCWPGRRSVAPPARVGA